jgi:hypothetical protein
LITIQAIAIPILERSQDLSDLHVGDQVICIGKSPHDWNHPLLYHVWTIDEVSEDTLVFQVAAGPDYKHYFDRRGYFKGLSWQDPSLITMIADRRLYRRSPEIEYLLLWRTLYVYIQRAWDDLKCCSAKQLKQFYRVLQRLDPQRVVSKLRPMTVEEILVPQTEYYLRYGDPFLTPMLTNAQQSRLAQVRTGMYVVWGHEDMFGWRYGRIKVTRTTKRFLWVGEPGVARKFDRMGRYRNQTHLDSYALYSERNDRLFLATSEVQELLERQQLIGDIYVRQDLLRQLPVEGLEPLYQLLKTFPHVTDARQDTASREVEIDQQLEQVPKCRMFFLTKKKEGGTRAPPGSCLLSASHSGLLPIPTSAQGAPV